MTFGIVTLALFGLTVIGAGVLAWYGTKHNWRGNDPPWKQKRKPPV